MKLHNQPPLLDPLRAIQRYGEQERRLHRLPAQPAQDAPTQTAPGESQSRGFAFSLGKLGVRYEEQEPLLDSQQLARMALERVQRERDAAFRAELEVEEIRSALANPPGAEEPLFPEQGEPPLHVQQTAHRAYLDQKHALQRERLRPGVTIGVV